MAHIINNECLACGSCESECKQNAIVAGGDKYTITADLCIDCGDCVEVCPVSAILPE